jgi:hypothetical protein
MIPEKSPNNIKDLDLFLSVASFMDYFFLPLPIQN